MAVFSADTNFNIRDRTDYVFEQLHAARRCRCGHISSDSRAPSECYSCGWVFPTHVPCPNCCAIINRIPDDRHRFCHTCNVPISTETCERLEAKMANARSREEQILRAARRNMPKTPRQSVNPALVYVETYKRRDVEENAS